MKVIWNNQLVEREDVKIDMEDRGYQFADGLYEVIRAYNGILFTAEQHVERLFTGAKKIDLILPFTREELIYLLNELIKENSIETGNIYLQITRGVSSPRNHTYPKIEFTSPVFTASTTVVPRNLETMKDGIKVITLPDMRWLHCDIKSISLLGNIMAKHEAHKKGKDEAILYRDEAVTECSASNVSIIKNKILYTHPDGNLILSGITKTVLLKVARQRGIIVKEETFTLKDLKEADEVFASSTTMEAMPVVEIDDKPVGDGKRGPVVKLLQELYVNEVELTCGSII
ncbi:D-alanine aminotransferase apoenzyme [Carnobacterium iners]|uniref:D-alanine aminotransferase n=1 Tax=Carnobacterium iners TaxID=1073423 RepID=A0A1X7NQ23_9LACT|nr:D-amino-acid transaminase [Carnobacterium iners]SEK27171.1 D-alanine aminotransferase apoenzyme [Carnobacterium iners]SMH40135.1 D-alanine aminotransferase apoenzyme [Carnobacterium iners]